MYLKNNILVTGNSGFIGKNLTYRLTVMGYEVHGIEQDIFSKINWHENLITKLNKIKPGAIFHVGAFVDTLSRDTQKVMIFNYEFTRLLATWSFENDVPLVYSSSAANYGINNRFPSNVYGWSKYVAENFVLEKEGLALRYFNVYGPGEEHKDNMASFIYQAYINFISRKPILIFPGNPMRDFVYIQDVISANIFALENFYSLSGRYFEVGSGESTSFEYLLNLLDVQYSYYDLASIPTGYQFYTKSDPSKWMPGWRPIYKIDTGIQEYKKYLEKGSNK